MPTVFTHAIVPLAVAAGLGRRTISTRLAWAGAAAAMLPDLDVIAFRFGIAYAHEFGHRGASHSLGFALLMAALAFACAPWLRSRRLVAAGFIGASTASHPLLDMLTDGGLGVALWWPWSDDRVFAALRVIEVSPISVRRFLDGRGWEVLQSEFVWVWLPAIAAALLLWSLRRLLRRDRTTPSAV